MIVTLVLLGACVAISYLFLDNAKRVEALVKQGKLKIQLGEGLGGPSYMIAISQGMGVIFGVLAVMLLIRLGTH